MSDTIVALSSGRPPAAIAVIRISGPAALAAAEAMAGGLPPPRRAGLRALRDASGGLLDHALVLVFPGPRSATGEDLVELHCHGGRAVAAAVEEAVLAVSGVRHAEPGEFTRRALSNGRIDLAQAEGLADLLAAETELQRRAALAAAEGALSRRVAIWSGRVNALSAEAEAAIDYDDEAEVASRPAVALSAGMGVLGTEMTVLLRNPPIERLRDGVRVVIAGPPNSGKSTLLNALTQRDVAIVSPIAGTTRDRIEAPVARAGVPFVLTDTAGLTDSVDPIEAIGVQRAKSAMAAADLVLWLGDDTPPAEALHVHARADLPDREEAPLGALVVSARLGQGIDALWEALGARASALLPAADELVLNARQRGLLDVAAIALRDGMALADPLLIAEQLRIARQALAAITGAQATEAMLDALFGRFCLGK